MAKQIKTSITINASKEKIWKILTDFENYSEWNSFIKSVTGKVKVGEQIKIKLQGMTFKPVVLIYNKNSELKWLGKLWFKGLFDGEHKFKLTENKNGTTTFEQSENFTGILVKLFSKNLEKTKKHFEQMNNELKIRSEKL
ncbi:polyketide cyclase [Polaribacter reichenbachii]|uniref:Polyketide cyclase n=1 Tax=Polaribacter reichenbachii TaxID=996801 RepID=A0A1B8TYQ0_9FLAO|nr:SRPBCC domain-containing protein [Polaribacter reichenbachii]APZ45863.1 polyketide cyclase [Polaribacter reichenbachii]AUC19725.1 polyketide cyclase [Polaribacter reichenbachii]OBY64704.1 polyketide cyclase [Polaribacter reichenbachii]